MLSKQTLCRRPRPTASQDFMRQVFSLRPQACISPQQLKTDTKKCTDQGKEEILSRGRRGRGGGGRGEEAGGGGKGGSIIVPFLFSKGIVTHCFWPSCEHFNECTTMHTQSYLPLVKRYLIFLKLKYYIFPLASLSSPFCHNLTPSS